MSNDKKILFIHVPKTAGSSIYRSFNLERVEKHITINYLQLHLNMNIDDYWLIGSVRNPWQRLFSLYNYTKICQYHTLNWKRWLFYSSNTAPISYNQEHFYRDVLNNNPLKQVNYFLDKEGNVAVDEIIQLERIERDIKKSNILEIDKFKTFYPSPRPMDPKKYKREWRNIYDSEDIEYVRGISEWEIDKFNYTFEEI